MFLESKFDFGFEKQFITKSIIKTITRTLNYQIKLVKQPKTTLKTIMFSSGKGAGMGGKGKGGKGKGGGKNFEGGRGKGKGKGGSQLSRGCTRGKNGAITADPCLLYKTVTWDKVKMGPYTVDGKIGTIDRDNSALIQYRDLLKEARVWNTQGQERLGREAERRASMILDGNFSGCEVPIRTEEFFYKNHKF